MKRKDYATYGLAIVGGVGLALWAGLPIYLLFLLACPLMMFFMMRGMHGGQGSHEGHRGHSGHENPGLADAGADADGPAGKQLVQPSPLDGSHERIDRP